MEKRSHLDCSLKMGSSTCNTFRLLHCYEYETEIRCTLHTGHAERLNEPNLYCKGNLTTRASLRIVVYLGCPLTNSALIYEPKCEGRGIAGSQLSANEYRAGIFKQSMGARNRGGIGLSYRPARLHRLAEFIPWNRFLGSINV
jgi:hypothetical protein